MSISCIRCGGTGKMINGQPCPECSKELNKEVPMAFGVPLQYQGVKFNKTFLPEKLQKPYGEFMENLMEEIIMNMNIYQKNILICSKPNSGKTIWAYNIYAHAISKGVNIAPIRDILEVRNILTSYNSSEADLFSNARCAIIKIPRDIQPWIFDTITTIIERRVRNNGFTIFLYGGKEDDLRLNDKYGRLSDMRGTGSFNSLKIHSFY